MATRTRLVSLFLSIVLVCFVASCTVIPKNVPTPSLASSDSTVPAEYVKMNGGDNGGFLFFDADRNAFLSEGARTKFNLLVSKYHIQFRDWMLVDVKQDQGVTPFTDQFGNHIWKMDRMVFKYFILLNQMHRNGTPGDSTWDKALDALIK